MSIVQSRLAIAYFFAAAGMSFTSWAVRTPYIQQALHIKKIDWGFLLLCPVISSFFSALIVNYLIEKYSNRRVLMTGVLLVSLSLILIGWANSLLPLGAAFLVFGAGMGLLNIAMNDQAAALERVYQRSIMASFHAIFSFGAMAGALMGSLFAEYNVPPVYHLSIIAMVIITGTFIVYPHLLVSTRTEQQVEKAPLITLPKGRLWIAGSIAAISVFIEGAMSDWAALYLKDMQAPDSVAAIGLACFTGAMAFGRLLGDRYINYWGSIRSIQIASWFTILGLFFSLLTYLPTVAILGFIITGLGVSIMFPCVLSLATRLKLTGMSASGAIAAVSMMGYISLLAGPPVIGFIAHTVGLHFSFFTLLIASIMLIVIVYFAKLN